MPKDFVLIGGSETIAAPLAALLRADANAVTIVAATKPATWLTGPDVHWVDCDVLCDDITLPPGDVVLTGPASQISTWPWTFALELGIATARLLPNLAGRRVFVVSSADMYGPIVGRVAEDARPVLPLGEDAIEAWCEEARSLARGPCPHWVAARLCRRLTDASAAGRWARGLAERARELLISAAIPETDRIFLRTSQVFGPGQRDVVTRLVYTASQGGDLPVEADGPRQFASIGDIATAVRGIRQWGQFHVTHPPITLRQVGGWITNRAVAETKLQEIVGGESLRPILDSTRLAEAGVSLDPLQNSVLTYAAYVREHHAPLFNPALGVVSPPRPALPDQLVERQQRSLWSGFVKYGNRWTKELEARLADVLELGSTDRVQVTVSGTAALRMAVAGVVGHAETGDIAVVPSFTYPATVEAVLQLGYTPVFADVSADTWTLDPKALEQTLSQIRAAVVVCVDTFGNPCDYRELRTVCSRAGVPLVADSAAAIGSQYAGSPVGGQADAHAFSMSFAKVLSAAGAGGAVVFNSAPRPDVALWSPSSLMDEFHAAAALDQLSVLSELTKRRRRVAHIYSATSERLPRICPQVVAPGNVHAYVHWVVRVPAREQVARKLAALGVQTRDYFRALHPRFGHATYSSLPVTEQLDGETLALPMSSEMTTEDAESVALALELALSGEEEPDLVGHAVSHRATRMGYR